MLNNPIDEIKKRNNIDEEYTNNRKPEWLFTRSRILFLISVFIVFSLPLIYRYISNFL